MDRYADFQKIGYKPNKENIFGIMLNIQNTSGIYLYFFYSNYKLEIATKSTVFNIKKIFISYLSN